MRKSSGELEYWSFNVFLGGVSIYIIYMICNALLGNGIDMYRRTFGAMAQAGPYYFESEPGKFCGMMLLYVFLLGGIIYYMRQLAHDRRFRLEMMRERGEL